MKNQLRVDTKADLSLKFETFLANEIVQTAKILEKNGLFFKISDAVHLNTNTSSKIWKEVFLNDEIIGCHQERLLMAKVRARGYLKSITSDDPDSPLPISEASLTPNDRKNTSPS